jgi:hypothetical protein
MQTLSKSIILAIAGALIGILMIPPGSSVKADVRFTPKPPAIGYQYSQFRTGPLEVAKVFGRSKGCENASPELILAVSEQAVNNSIDPRIAAATVAIESACNQFAVSSRGALGFTQVVPKIWCGKYDCTIQYNYLNLRDNIQVGISILAGLIHTYGEKEGVRRYQGLGVGCDTCDGAYTEKIISLARR